MEMDMRWIMKCTGLLCAALLFALCPVVTAGIITVPGDAGAIKDAISLAQDGDEVEIAPGAYTENGIVVDKDITIRSKTGTKSAARVTIDGSEKTVFTITGAARLIGLDITNAQKPVIVHGKGMIERCVFYDNKSDVISFEAEGSGTVEYCIIQDAGDDGIDVDSETGNIAIRKNRIFQCDDDGIEIRLKPTREVMVYTIKENVITGCGEDGIQLIDYPDASPREFVISGNYISDNAMAGIGCMADGNTRENYQGSHMEEPVLLYGNVLKGNTVGLTTAPGLTLGHTVYVRNATNTKP